MTNEDRIFDENVMNDELQDEPENKEVKDGE